MRKEIIITILSVIILVSLSKITGNAVIESFECPESVELTYYYSPNCIHCKNTAPLIEELINNGCKVNKFDVQEYYDLAINNNVYSIPTLIIGDNRLTGEFTLEQVKDLITNNN